MCRYVKKVILSKIFLGKAIFSYLHHKWQTFMITLLLSFGRWQQQTIKSTTFFLSTANFYFIHRQIKKKLLGAISLISFFKLFHKLFINIILEIISYHFLNRLSLLRARNY